MHVLHVRSRVPQIASPACLAAWLPGTRCGRVWTSQRQFGLCWIVHAAFDFVGGHLGHAARHLEFGGRVRAVEGDAKPEAELAVVIGTVLGIIEVGV